ncbi:MAG TPA: diviva domain containing protein, partial [Cytophagales bacterium]|nr:diviva domain containing protein [Cytophagales bacterium]
MKITPLEIRQKTFEKGFRGYDKDEVNAFLGSLSGEWERMIDENKDLRSKLEAADKEVNKLREVENSLFKTLQTAESTGNTIMEQANRQAELELQGAQMKADKLLEDARTQAQQTIDTADRRAEAIVREMQVELKTL